MKKILLTVSLFILFFNINAFDTGKKPIKAMTLSLFIPGAGQFYNEKYIKSGVIIGIQTSLIGLSIYNHNRMNRYYDRAIASTGDDFLKYEQKYFDYYNKRQNTLWWLSFSAILSCLDAFVDASLFNYDSEKNRLEILFEKELVILNFRF